MKRSFKLHSLLCDGKGNADLTKIEHVKKSLICISATTAESFFDSERVGYTVIEACKPSLGGVPQGCILELPHDIQSQQMSQAHPCIVGSLAVEIFFVFEFCCHEFNVAAVP